MKVVMTGAAGGVGTMTRPHLVGVFEQMIVSDRREITELHEGESFVQADLTDMAAMERLLEGADGIIHLGGQPLGSRVPSLAWGEPDAAGRLRAWVEGLPLAAEPAAERAA